MDPDASRDATAIFYCQISPIYIDFIPLQIDAFDALHDPTCTVETDVILLEGCGAAVWNRQS